MLSSPSTRHVQRAFRCHPPSLPPLYLPQLGTTLPCSTALLSMACSPHHHPQLPSPRPSPNRRLAPQLRRLPLAQHGRRHSLPPPLPPVPAVLRAAASAARSRGGCHLPSPAALTGQTASTCRCRPAQPASLQTAGGGASIAALFHVRLRHSLCPHCGLASCPVLCHTKLPRSTTPFTSSSFPPSTTPSLPSPHPLWPTGAAPGWWAARAPLGLPAAARQRALGPALEGCGAPRAPGRSCACAAEWRRTSGAQLAHCIAGTGQPEGG